MALYADPRLVRLNAPDEFDIFYSPGEAAPYDGIYGCQACFREALGKKDEPLPQHTAQTSHTARWHMVVFAETRYGKMALPKPGSKPKSKKSTGAKKKI